MKIRFYGSQSLRTFVVCFVILLTGLTSLTSQAQTTINTTAVTGIANNNGSGMVVFNFQNTNSFPVQITQVEGIVGTSGATVAEVWYRTTPLTGTTLAAGSISVANGWTMGVSQSFTGVANTTSTNLTTQVMITGATITIPANVTYAMAITAYSGTAGRLRYYTLASPNLPSMVVSGGGVNLLMGNGTQTIHEPAPRSWCRHPVPRFRR